MQFKKQVMECFIGISKHQEEVKIRRVAGDIFAILRGVRIADETLSRVFDITSIENLKRRSKFGLGYPNLLHDFDFLCFYLT